MWDLEENRPTYAPDYSPKNKGGKIQNPQLFIRHKYWREACKNYELRLAKYLNVDARPKKAVTAALNRAKEVLTAFYTNNTEDDILGSFTNDSKESAGQIGKKAAKEEINKLFGDEANLREQMTAFMNATYMNWFRDEGKSLSLKNIVNSAVAQKSLSSLQGLNLKDSSLTQEINKRRFWGGNKKLWIINKWSGTDIFDYKQLAFAINNSSYTEESLACINAKMFKDILSPQQKSALAAKKKSKSYYDSMDAPLSERELAFAKENANVADDTKDFQLTWEPGESTMLLDTRKKIMRQYAAKGFITASGVSGTTIRMLKAFDILNVPADILDFRLGVMTWMLTCADHTLYEMLRSSHMMVRPPNENLSDAVNMYQNIEPLTVADERAIGPKPHEMIYSVMLQEDDESSLHDYGIHNTGVKLVRTDRNIDKNFKDERQAIFIYSTAVFQLMNIIKRIHRTGVLGNYHAKKYLKYYINSYIDKILVPRYKVDVSKEQNSLTKTNNRDIGSLDQPFNFLEKEYEYYINKLGDPIPTSEEFRCYITKFCDDKLVERVYERLLVHMDILDDALSKNSGNDNVLNVYRGDWMSTIGSQYNKDTFTLGNGCYTSTSWDQNAAKKFLKKRTGTQAVLFNLQLGWSGVDIESYSRWPEQHEVLLGPKTVKFQKIKPDEVCWAYRIQHPREDDSSPRFLGVAASEKAAKAAARQKINAKSEDYEGCQVSVFPFRMIFAREILPENKLVFNNHILSYRGRASFEGTKPLHIYYDKNEANWLFKESKNSSGRSQQYRGYLSEAAYHVQNIVDPETAVELFVENVPGKGSGTFQKMVDVEKEGIDLWKWQKGEVQKSSPSAEQYNQLLREHVTDWLISNFDAHGENFVMNKQGIFIGIDKEAAMRQWKKEETYSMNITYAPRARGGIGSVYNTLFARYIEGKIDLDFQQVVTYIQRVEAVNDNTYISYFEKFIETFVSSERDRKKLREYILKRKQNLREEYRKFFTMLIKSRYKDSHQELLHGKDFIFSDESGTPTQSVLAGDIAATD